MGKRTVVAILAVATLVLLGAGAVGWSATDQQTLTINAAVAAKAKLTLGVATINFPDSDPDSQPSIGATQNPVTVTVKAQTGSSSTVALSVQANGDLDSGGNTIPITKVTWTASGAGFVAGTMDTSAQPAGS